MLSFMPAKFTFFLQFWLVSNFLNIGMLFHPLKDIFIRTLLFRKNTHSKAHFYWNFQPPTPSSLHLFDPNFPPPPLQLSSSTTCHWLSRIAIYLICIQKCQPGVVLDVLLSDWLVSLKKNIAKIVDPKSTPPHTQKGIEKPAKSYRIPERKSQCYVCLFCFCFVFFWGGGQNLLTQHDIS